MLFQIYFRQVSKIEVTGETDSEYLQRLEEYIQDNKMRASQKNANQFKSDNRERFVEGKRVQKII